MNGDRLLFLLKHEFRLWNRSPQGWRAQWKNLLGWYPLLWLVGCSVLWAQNHFQLPQIHFSAASPSAEAIWISGGIAGYALLMTLIILIFQKQPAAQIQPSIDWSFSSPQPSKIMFASATLHSILTTFISLHIGSLFFSLPLALLCHSFQSFVGIHLTMTGWSILAASLNAWVQYFSKRYSTHKSCKLFRKIFVFITSGVAFLLFGLPYGIGGSFISAQQAIAMYSQLIQKGHLFGSDSWIWIPGRTLFLDPLPSLVLIVGSLGLLWLTIQKLHHSYLKTLQPSVEAHKKPKVSINPIQFQSNLTRLLIVREWRNFRFSLANLIFLMVLLSSFPCLLSLPFIIWKISSMGLAEPLALGFITGSWSALMGSSYTSRVFEMEDSYMLLSSAPVSLSRVGWCKRFAVLIPLWATSFPIVLLTGVTGRPWGWVALFVVAAPLCQVMLRSWNTVPVPSWCAWDGLPYSGQRCGDYGRDLRVLFWCEMLSLCLWAAALSLIFMGQTLWGLLALALEVGLMAIAYRRNNQIGDIWSD
jgi:ABC-2 type transport system permease protein